MALTFLDSKAFESLTRDQFVRFAAKSGLPERLTVNTMHETVAAFADVWSKSDVVADQKTRDAIDRHLKGIPIWGDVAN